MRGGGVGELAKRAAAANKHRELTVERRTWQSIVDVPLQGEGDEVRLRAGKTLRLEALATCWEGQGAHGTQLELVYSQRN